MFVLCLSTAPDSVTAKVIQAFAKVEDATFHESRHINVLNVKELKVSAPEARTLPTDEHRAALMAVLRDNGSSWLGLQFGFHLLISLV